MTRLTTDVDIHDRITQEYIDLRQCGVDDATAVEVLMNSHDMDRQLVESCTTLRSRMLYVARKAVA